MARNREKQKNVLIGEHNIVMINERGQENA
jgi:hypothetical protein